MDSLKDKVEGQVDKAKGRGKEAVGNVTGDDQKQAEGQVDKTKGGAKETLGDAKEKARDLKESLTD